MIMNPPFGTKKEHTDRAFLEKAFSIAKVIYSIHKSSTKKFVEAISKDNGFRVTHEWNLKLPIKRSYRFHTKPRVNIEACCFRIEKETFLNNP